MDNLKIIASKKNWIDSRSVDSLKKISKFQGIISVVGLPDLSVGEVPNGVAILSKDRIYPHLIGGDIGCGMSLYEAKIKPKKIKIDKFAKELDKIEGLEQVKLENAFNQYNLGTIGRGNHFAELHLVNSIEDEILFNKLNMGNKSLFILVHSGSRGFGQHVFDKVAGSYDASCGMDIYSKEAMEYLNYHDMAIAYAKQSRYEIAQKIAKTIKIGSELITISDTAHNSITKLDGQFLHRKGATPTDKGAVIIAGSRGSLSYLVEPLNNTSISNYSLSHGAGRKWERSSAEAKLRNRYSKSDLLRTSINSRVICSDAKLLYEEAPEAYKDIDVVISDLIDANLLKVIATFRPIVTYKE